ncbi:PucR family transcriptional regulator [Actinomadura craniellae]|uniref:PucR family transcriptional regulator n=2 Tax=Actinomadura craniellae TaxID=2231787 RepID=A0A365GW77_9ACTN|nr:PucR family transcriptional regulator [Actinomadura craniellae]
MRPHLPHLNEVMVAGVLRHVPEYARADEIYVQVARAATARAMEHFVQMIADPETSWDEVHQMFFDVGYGEAIEGRGLEHLQNAMRISSRIGWRYLSVEGERLGKPRALISLLAEVNFAYLDQLASAAAQGYARAREKTAGEREQRRARLLSLLLAEPAVLPEVIAEQVSLAGWPMPKRLAVILLQPRPGGGGVGPTGLPPSWLVGVDRGQHCVIMPDPDGPGQAERLSVTLAGWTGAVGPTAPPEEARVSLRWARRALDLVAEGTIPARDPSRLAFLVRAEEYLPGLLLQEGRDLARMVASRRLAPLTDAGPRQGPRLAATLLECLKNGFNATDAATALCVHPQTVRYRLGQLHKLFDFDLEDPEIRLEMMLLVHTWMQDHAEPSAG